MSYIWPKVLFLRSPVTSILVNSLDSSKSSSCLIISTWQSLSSHHSRNILHLAYRIPHSPAFFTSHFSSIFFCWLLQSSSFHFGNILGFLLFIISSLITIDPWKVQYSSWHYLAIQLFHCCLYACFWTSWAWNKDTELLYSVKNTKAQPLVEDARMWQCMPDAWANLHDWTCERMFEYLKACS